MRAYAYVSSLFIRNTDIALKSTYVSLVPHQGVLGVGGVLAGAGHLVLLSHDSSQAG